MQTISQKYTSPILIGVFILAILLRCWDFTHLPLIHDELSAWSRLQFSSFSELIEQGVKPDGHPAGVQVFLWIWVKLLGDKPWVMKLPFLMMGVGCLMLSHQITKKWFGWKSALLVLACMATQQFAITFGSQIARPYASGLFLSLLMVWSWIKLSEKENTKTVSLYIVSSVLCLYNHHFSALFAGIVWLSAFLLAKNKKTYLFSLVGIIVLYLPHLPIFLDQLSRKGLEWVGKPDAYFFAHYGGYIFHYSYAVYLVVAGIFLYSFALIFRNNIQAVDNEINNDLSFGTKRMLCLTWFFAPLLTGFAYSVWIMPLLQVSMLIFTYPFLLMFLFSYARYFNTIALLSSVCLVLVVNLYSLIITREHFDINYHHPHKDFYEYALHQQEKWTNQAQIIYSIRDTYVNYYAQQNHKPINVKYLYKDVKDLKTWQTLLDSMKQPEIIVGNLPHEYVLLAQQKFPYLIDKQLGFTFDIYHFSKVTKTNLWEKDIYSNLSKNIDNQDNKIEFVLPSNAKCEDWINAKLTWECDTNQVEGSMKLLFFEGNQMIGERSINLERLSANPVHTTVLGERLMHIFAHTNYFEDKKVMIQLEISDKYKSHIRLKNIDLSFEKGNPKLYKWVYEQ